MTTKKKKYFRTNRHSCKETSGKKANNVMAVRITNDGVEATSTRRVRDRNENRRRRRPTDRLNKFEHMSSGFGRRNKSWNIYYCWLNKQRRTEEVFFVSLHNSQMQRHIQCNTQRSSASNKFLLTFAENSRKNEIEVVHFIHSIRLTLVVFYFFFITSSFFMAIIDITIIEK